MSESLEFHPQNPYKSFIVSASAGCGKTYQLSRRFLFLVAAGAKPQSILTITFTKKAASEMRERILADAAELLFDEELAKKFDLEVLAFYSWARSQSSHNISLPITAEMVAKKILASTQLLSITTIDSIFMQWVQKFSWESRIYENKPISPDIDLLNAIDEQELNEDCWSATLYSHHQDPEFKFIHEYFSVDEQKMRLFALKDLRSFIWLSEKQSNQAFLRLHPIISTDISCDESFIESLRSPLTTIANLCNKDKVDILLRAIESNDLEKLIEAKLLKKDLSVHGNTIKGKKRTEYEYEINLIDETAKNYFNFKKTERLNKLGFCFSKNYKLFERAREESKYQNKKLEFDDLLKGSYNLFHEDLAIGARYLIHRRTQHLLLDEFQDTSRLQWEIFKALGKELISGEGLENDSPLKPSIFIVGDKKQSIYGFREAESKIMDTACEDLAPWGVRQTQLRHSYRTAQIVLDVVNLIFNELYEDFPEHETARIQDEVAVVANHGSYTINQAIEVEGRSKLELIEKEAEYVASFIDRAIHVDRVKIYDKQTKKLRNITQNDCAVLYRSSTYSHIFEQKLRDVGLDVQREEAKGFFLRPEISDLFALCKYLSQPNDSLALAQVLKSPWTPISDTDFLEASWKAKKLSTTNPVSFCHHLLESLESSHRAFISHFKLCIEAAFKLSAFQSIEYFYRDFSIIRNYEHVSSDAESKLVKANLEKFLELVHDLDTNHGYSMPMVTKKLNELCLLDEIGSQSSSGEGVKMMTIHKSKGLEFGLVALVLTGENWEKTDPYWMKNLSTEDLGIYFIDTKANQPSADEHFDSIRHEVDEQQRDESSRLLYVALTRARHHLLITGSKTNEKTYEESFHSLIYKLSKNRYQADAADIKYKVDAELDSAEPIATTTSLHYEFEPISSSNSGLISLAPSRLLQKEERPARLLKSPFHPFEKHAGSFLHEALEKHMIQGELNKDELEKIWLGFYENSDKKQYLALLPLLINEYYAVTQSQSFTQLSEKANRLWTEKAIVHLDRGQLIRGSLDLLLEVETNRFVIVDYKTNFDITGLRARQAWIKEHRYDEQLRVYKEALKAIYPKSEVNCYVYATASKELLLCSEEFNDPYEKSEAVVENYEDS